MGDTAQISSWRLNTLLLSASRRSLAVIGALLLVAVPCQAQDKEPLDALLRESVHRIEVTVTDYFGRSETLPVLVTEFRPLDAKPHPLLILNHGRAVDPQKRKARQRMIKLAEWFVGRGFVVMVPTRIGYGPGVNLLDPEYVNACKAVSLERQNLGLLSQISAVHALAATLPEVDARRWLIAGVSVGGYVATTLARYAPPGLTGAINFSGGYGGDPDRKRGQPCGAWAWEKELSRPVGGSAVPVLWLYWQNDYFWGDRQPVAWFKAFVAGGGQGEFMQFQELKDTDGHLGMARDMQHWADPVDRFLFKVMQ